MDMPGAEEELSKFKAKLDGEKEIFPISALTGTGLEPLLWRIAQLLEEIPPVVMIKEEEIRKTLVREKERFRIEQDEYGLWVVSGEETDKLIKMTDLERDDSLIRLQRIFSRMGLEEALVAAGVREGDTVRIGDVEFEYTE
jgi:GTP-binding protein